MDVKEFQPELEKHIREINAELKQHQDMWDGTQLVTESGKILGYQHKAGHLCSAGSRSASLIAALRKSGTAFRSTSVPSYVGSQILQGWETIRHDFA